MTNAADILTNRISLIGDVLPGSMTPLSSTSEDGSMQELYSLSNRHSVQTNSSANSNERENTDKRITEIQEQKGAKKCPDKLFPDTFILPLFFIPEPPCLNEEKVPDELNKLTGRTNIFPVTDGCQRLT